MCWERLKCKDLDVTVRINQVGLLCMHVEREAVGLPCLTHMRLSLTCRSSHVFCVFFCSIPNTINPAWTHVFETDYRFGKEERFNVGIFHQGSTQSGKPKSIGSASFEIGEVLGARGTKAKALRDGGTVFVRITPAKAQCTGVVRGKFRGLKLKNVDGFLSKSDPFYTISTPVDDPSGRSWKPVYRSEAIDNNLDPVWNSFSLSLHQICGGNKDLPLRIEVSDWEKSGKHKPMGYVETTLNALIFLMGNSERKLPLLLNNRPCGFLQLDAMHVTGETAPGANLGPSAVPPKFVKVNGINKVNPEYQKWKAAHEATTPATTGTLPSAPVGPSVPISLSAAPTTSPMPPPKFIKVNGINKVNPEYKKWAASQGPPTSSFDKPTPTPLTLASLPPSMPPPDVGSRAGSTDEKPSFVDYIAGGMEINLLVAIDYTGSNGDPRRPGTLHYIHPDGQLNDYEKALTAVGSIVARYDSDQMFPVLGFGAKYSGVIRHCFQVGNAPELRGIAGILEAYRGVFRTGLTMSGPTVFAEVINYAANHARSKQQSGRAVGKQIYDILLILTDGAVTDIEETKRAIVNASTAPLSIVIVGIGSADFSAMQFLDDFQRDEGGHTRDIVQFVEFGRHMYSREDLTRETLDEIPDQLVQHFFSQGIMPLPPASGSKLNINPEGYNPDEDIDLTISVNSEGEVYLSQPAQATWDAHAYARASEFLPSAPPGAYGGQNMNASFSTAYSTTSTRSVPTPVQIQAPSNAYPGMQLRVQNPTTGQFQIITVPQGVMPGSRFIVQL